MRLLASYVAKMRGGLRRGSGSDVRSACEIFACSFVVILLLGELVDAFTGDWTGVVLIPSFGASCVLIFGTPQAESAQPRNVIGGHVLAAISGVAAFGLFGTTPVAAAFAVAAAGAGMHLTGTMHPPGGATALLAVIGDDALHAQGFAYALVPVGIGAVIIVLMGVIVNTICLHRHYPERWL